MNDFMIKLQNGEYLWRWNGYTPHYAGCAYGSFTALGGEEKYKHCYGGVADAEWWVKAELDKLSEEEKSELLYIMKRNEEFYGYKRVIAEGLAKLLNVEAVQIHRLTSKELYDFIQLVGSKVHLRDSLPEYPNWKRK